MTLNKNESAFTNFNFLLTTLSKEAVLKCDQEHGISHQTNTASCSLLHSQTGKLAHLTPAPGQQVGCSSTQVTELQGDYSIPSKHLPNMCFTEGNCSVGVSYSYYSYSGQYGHCTYFYLTEVSHFLSSC